MAWFKQEDSKTGYEVDENGIIQSQVVFRGETPYMVITQPLPGEISSPVWNFDKEKWEENNNG